MKVLIQGKQMRVSDELKGYVHDRLVKQLTRFLDDPAAELRVEFGDTNGPKGGEDKECHLTLHIPNARTIQIEEATRDPYASLDAATGRLIRRAKRELEKRRSPLTGRMHRPLAAVVAEGGVPAGPIEELPDAPEWAEVADELGTR